MIMISGRSATYSFNILSEVDMSRSLFYVRTSGGSNLPEPEIPTQTRKTQSKNFENPKSKIGDKWPILSTF